MSADLAAIAYLVASILFIMALRGLSSPETARNGNVFGIVGIIIAIATTLACSAAMSSATRATPREPQQPSTLRDRPLC